MSILINAHDLTKSFSARPLFRGITVSLDEGEKVGLIGPNGAGKSTLLRIFSGQMSPDSGTLSLRKGLRVGFVEQVPQFTKGTTIRSELLHSAVGASDWEASSKAEEMISKLAIPREQGGPGADAEIDSLSGDWKKRVAIARELVKDPEVLLLDEPTNHLDVESILWLEDLIAHAPFSTLFITHDRAFLSRVCNRILELDRRNPDGLLSVKGDYSQYLETKQALMDAQQSRETRLRNTLRRETEWLRRGAKARTTKQQARIQRHEALDKEVGELATRNFEQKVRLDFGGSEKNPKKLIEAKKITKSYNGKIIVPPVDLLITPKSRIGLLGANGCGKSTLLKMLLGEVSPDRGEVFQSEHLLVSYFEQNRETLDPDLTVVKTVCPMGDQVDFCGKRIHVRGYLDRFLFRAEQLEMRVGQLSGGEASRLLLARLMLHEANVLVLDEPTNDLDVETLDVLEEVLKEFSGAVCLVTHDRYFLDQVATEILAFGRDSKGESEIVKFSGLSQWEDWHEGQMRLKANVGKQRSQASTGSSEKKKRLGFKEQRELDGMEAAILKGETKLAELQAESTQPSVLSNSKRLTELTQEMATLQNEIDRLYVRWQELGGI